MAGNCKKDEPAANRFQQTCDTTAKTVKTITDAVGVVAFNQSLIRPVGGL